MNYPIDFKIAMIIPITVSYNEEVSINLTKKAVHSFETPKF